MQPGLIVRLLFMLLGSVGVALGNDWPQWRGTNRDDISAETGLLQSWPAGGPKLVWKRNGLGEGFSGLAIAGERVFTIGDRSGVSFVTSLESTNGKAIWSAKLGKGGAPGGYGGPRSTPTVDGMMVYALGQWGELACLDAASGREKWRK